MLAEGDIVKIRDVNAAKSLKGHVGVITSMLSFTATNFMQPKVYWRVKFFAFPGRSHLIPEEILEKLDDVHQ